MFKLPMEWIVGGSAIVALFLALVFTAQGCNTVKAKLESAELREKGWIEEQTKCAENQVKLEEAIADLAIEAQKNVILEATLQGSTDAIHDEAVERAKAEAELGTIKAKYANLSTRAVDMNLCQTYRLALAALAGGPP